jgi:hypothetical protein
MATLNARLITRTDWDVKWQQSGLVLQPGELAISIPTRPAESGETPITELNDRYGMRVFDDSADIVIKIGNSDTFCNQSTTLPDGITHPVNGSNGVLVNLEKNGVFDGTLTNPSEFVKDQTTGKTILKIREANVSYDDQNHISSVNSGVMSENAYKDYIAIADFFRSGSDPTDHTMRVTANSIAEKLIAAIPIDEESIVYDEQTHKIRVGDIIWQCNQQNNS